MNSKNGTVARRFLIPLGIMLTMAALILGAAISPAAFADDGDLAAGGSPSLGNANKPARTIMIYLDGAASEENGSACTDMLEEYMASKFDRSDFRIIVMTGGSLKWHLDAATCGIKTATPER